MKKACIVYPFSEAFSAVMNKISDSNFDYSIKALVTPRTWAAIGRFIPREQSELISFDFNIALKTCDVVIIADCINRKYMVSDIISKIRASLLAQKHVICYFPLVKDQIMELEKESSLFEYNGPDLGSSKNETFSVSSKTLPVIDSVVIGIGRLVGEVDVGNAIFEVESELSKKGYKVSAISHNCNGMILKHHPFPENLFDEGLSNDDKVYCFANYIHEIEMCNRPDVIIVEIPYGMIKISNSQTNQFGINAYIISQAIDFDYFILVSPIMDGAEVYDKIKECFVGRYGVNLLSVVIRNKVIDPFAETKGETTVFSVDQKLVDEWMAEMDSSINVYGGSKPNYTMLVEQIITELS